MQDQIRDFAPTVGAPWTMDTTWLQCYSKLDCGAIAHGESVGPVRVEYHADTRSWAWLGLSCPMSLDFEMG